MRFRPLVATWFVLALGCSAQTEHVVDRRARASHRPEVPPASHDEALSPERKQGARSRWRIDIERPMSFQEIADASETPPDSEGLGDELREAGADFLYGPSFGRSTLNIATAILFPPYALYLLGNAILSVSGYEQLHITDALPEAEREQVLGVYDSVTSVPGRISAGIAGEEYREEKADSR